MKILCYLLCVIFPPLLMYLIGSFIMLSFDIRGWNESGRAIGAISSLMLTGVCIAVTADEFKK